MKPHDKIARRYFLPSRYFFLTAFPILSHNPTSFVQTKSKQTWERMLAVEWHHDRNQPNEAYENKNLKELFVR
jgi:hypothetical protein